jgi:hypothetical protein
MVGAMGSTSGARALDTASYTLTVSKDARFLPTVYDLTAKTTETLNCDPEAARRLARAVQRLVEAIVGLVEDVPSGSDLVDVRFETDPGTLHVAITTETPPARRGWSLERALAESGQLDAVRALMPDAEFVAIGSQHVCRMTCALSPRS